MVTWVNFDAYNKKIKRKELNKLVTSEAITDEALLNSMELDKLIRGLEQGNREQHTGRDRVSKSRSWEHER